jgi:hypothetical protein
MITEEHEIAAMTDGGAALLAARRQLHRLVNECEQLHDEQRALRRKHAENYARLERTSEFRENRLKRENEALAQQLDHALDEASGAAFEDEMANDRARREEEKKAALEAVDRLNEQEERNRKRAEQGEAKAKEGTAPPAPADAAEESEEREEEGREGEGDDAEASETGKRSVYFYPSDSDDDVEDSNAAQKHNHSI